MAAFGYFKKNPTYFFNNVRVSRNEKSMLEKMFTNFPLTDITLQTINFGDLNLNNTKIRVNFGDLNLKNAKIRVNFGEQLDLGRPKNKQISGISWLT